MLKVNFCSYYLIKFIKFEFPMVYTLFIIILTTSGEYLCSTGVFSYKKRHQPMIKADVLHLKYCTIYSST